MLIFVLLNLASSMVFAAQPQYPFDDPRSSRGLWNNPGFNYAHCAKETINSTTTPFDANGKFRQGCAPEVLYSWQDKGMIDFYLNNSTPENLLPLQRLFAWRTPMWLYPYGDAALRIKLKPTTRFVNLPFHLRTQAYNQFGWNTDRARTKGCELWQQQLNTKAQTVFVSIHADYSYQDSQRVQEYIFCDSSAIESFSVITPEIFQEFQWEIDQILKRNTTTSSDSMTYDLPVQTDRLPWYAQHDNKNSSPTKWLTNFNWMSANFDHPRYSKIYYAADVTPDRSQHFAVTRPTYYNRRAFLPELNKITSVNYEWADENGDWREMQNPLGVTTSCIGQNECFWFLNPITLEKKLTTMQAVRVLWTCENSAETYGISALTADLSSPTAFEHFFLNSLLNPRCTNQEKFKLTNISRTPGTDLEIVNAKYVAPGEQDADITAPVANFCNHQKICNYKVDRRFLSIRSFSSDAKISIEYRCSANSPTTTLLIESSAEYQIWRLNCLTAPERTR